MCQKYSDQSFKTLSCHIKIKKYINVSKMHNHFTSNDIKMKKYINP